METIKCRDETFEFDLSNLKVTEKVEKIIRKNVKILMILKAKSNIIVFYEELIKFLEYFKTYNKRYYTCNIIDDFKSEHLELFKHYYKKLALNIIIDFDDEATVYSHRMLNITKEYDFLTFSEPIDFKILRIIVIKTIIDELKIQTNENII